MCVAYLQISNGHNLTTTNRPPLNANSTYYTFTKNRSEVSTPENNTRTTTKWLTSQSNIALLTIADVDNGIIFKNNNSSSDIGINSSIGGSSSSSNNDFNAYDLVILGHQEYVTQKEYDNLRKFVANGGTMIILDGNVFY